MKIRECQSELLLKNDGSLSVFSVGVGSAFTKAYFQNNYMLIKGDKHIMIDCGTRAPEAIHKLGRNITDIENFIITHSHADHIGGLEEVILSGRYMTQKKPNVLITKEYQKLLWEHSLKGGAAWNEFKGNRNLEFEDFWTIDRPKKFSGLGRDAWRADYQGFDIILFRTMHYPDSAPSWKQSAFSTGLVVDERFLFTGDTRFDPEMIEVICRKFPIEVIFHDVQFFPGGVHTNFQDLLGLPENIREKTYLMHYPDSYMNHEEAVLSGGFRGFVRQHHYYDFP